MSAYAGGLFKGFRLRLSQCAEAGGMGTEKAQIQIRTLQNGWGAVVRGLCLWVLVPTAIGLLWRVSLMESNYYKDTRFPRATPIP